MNGSNKQRGQQGGQAGVPGGKWTEGVTGGRDQATRPFPRLSHWVGGSTELSYAWLRFVKRYRLQPGIGRDGHTELSLGKARWEWGLGALAALFQASLLTTPRDNVQEAIQPPASPWRGR